MATYNKFNIFGLDLGLQVHQLDVNVLKIYASNSAPDPELHTLKANIAEIAATGGYPAGGSDVQATYTRVTTISTLTAGINPVWNASSGSFGPLRYIILYNDDTPAKVDPLIAWWDYGAGGVTVNLGESFTTQFAPQIFTLS